MPLQSPKKSQPRIEFKLRKEFKKKPIRIVVKIGSAGVADASGIKRMKLSDIAKDLQILLQAKYEIILVSSGAIQAGSSLLGMPAKGNIEVFQALSAVGQPMLMTAYQEAFSDRGLVCGQVLLTHEDMGNRQRNLNLRNTLLRLLNYDIVAIVNENDSVSYAEITVGDNDQLAAMVAESISADLLILLTGPDGLYTNNPNEDGSKKLVTISADDDFRSILTKGRSSSGRGGMKTKLDAVRRVTPLGIPVIIASYETNSPICSALTGGGSFFAPENNHKSGQRQRWLASSAKAHAKIKIDEGAYHALKKGASLLPSGIRSCEGTFRRGDCIAIVYRNRIIGQGLTEYSVKHLDKIKGYQSGDITNLLGNTPSQVAIHRNNLILRAEK